MKSPKVLVFDIETAPIKAYVWKIWEENVGLSQILSDWHLLSWSAKWLGEKELFYMDQRGRKNVEDDSVILRGLWELLDEADVVITQNGKKFDAKKVNARFAIHGMKSPSPYKHMDTLQMAKKHFSFTSNSLEFLSEKLCGKKKKKKSRKFVGFELWAECLKGNRKAWREMEKYNKADVVSTEELYLVLRSWGGSGVNLNVFREGAVFTCQCGSANLQSRGFHFTAQGKFQRYQCKDCAAWTSESGAKTNLLSKGKQKSLKQK